MSFFKKLNDIATTWELLLIVAISYTLVDVPLEAAFNHPATLFEIALDILIAGLFLMDALRFNRKFYWIQSAVVGRLLQFVMSIPVVALFSFWAESVPGWVLYVQLIRVALLPSLIVLMIERSKTHIVPKRFKLVSAALVTIVCLNILACIWLVIYPATEDSLTSYNKAMYWLVTTIATVGYGDITPTTNIGRVYTMGVMVLGATIWGILIASASRMMLASDRRKEQKKERIDALHSFFSHYEVPKELQREVVGFFHHQWARKVSEDERAILNDLPPALQQELHVYMNLKPISRVNLFRGTSRACLSDVAQHLEQLFISPGQKIIAKDEIGEDMYLIGHGTVNVHIGDQFITSLGPGACFGEMALIGHPKRASDVTAASYCDIFKLSKKQFDELIANHADLRANVVRIAAERQSKLKDDTAFNRPFDKIG